MKLSIKHLSIFKLSAASTFRTMAFATLTLFVNLLAAAPTHAQTASPVALQCQVNPAGIVLACNGTTPAGSVSLNCQVSAVSNNNGVYAIAGGTCSISSSVAALSLSETITGALITIDTNSGLIYVHDTDTATLTIGEGLTSVTVTTGGGPFFLNLAQPSLTLVDGTLNIGVNVLGLPVAQVTGQGNGASISLASSPSPTLTINAANICGTASLLGILKVDLPSGSPATINLGQLLINLPVSTCNA